MHQRWEEYLLAEHALIERILAVLEIETRKQNSRQADYTRVHQALILLLEFGDKAHNVKEENHLFPLMVLRGLPQAGLIHAMLMDHEAERELIVQLLPKAAKLEESDAEETLIVGKKIAEYVTARRQHLAKESKELYAQALEVLKPDDNKRLVQAFAKIDKVAYGGKSTSHVIQLVQQIEKETERIKAEGAALPPEVSEVILQALPWLIVFADADDRVVYTNRAQKAPAHSQLVAQIGSPLRGFLPKEIEGEALTAVDKLRSNALQKAEWPVKIHGRPLLLRMLPVRRKEGIYLGTLLVLEEQPELRTAKK